MIRGRPFLTITAAAMLVAAPDLPSPLLVVATLLGGALAAGGAAAINAYMDRDIDPRDRSAGLRLLYAPPLTRTAALKTSDIEVTRGRSR